MTLRPHAVGHRRGGLDHQRPAHAVALGADLLRLVHLLLRVQEGNERNGVLLGGARRVHRRHQRLELRHVGRILEIEIRGIRERSFGNTIERIGHQDGVSLGGDALAYFAHRGPQAEGVGPDQHARMGAAVRMDEGRVAGSVRSLDLDIHLHDRQPRARSRPGSRGNSGGYGQTYKVAPRQVARRIMHLSILRIVRHWYLLFQILSRRSGGHRLCRP